MHCLGLALSKFFSVKTFSDSSEDDLFLSDFNISVRKLIAASLILRILEGSRFAMPYFLNWRGTKIFEDMPF